MSSDKLEKEGWEPVTVEQRIAAEDRLVVVDCYAEWCGPCKRISPEIDQLESKYEGKIRVIKVNIDEEDTFSRNSFSYSREIFDFLIKTQSQAFQQSSSLRPVKRSIDRLVLI